MTDILDSSMRSPWGQTQCCVEGEEVLAFRCAGFSLWIKVHVTILHLIIRSEAQGAGFLGQARHHGDTKITLGKDGKAQGRRQAPAKSCDPGTIEMKPGGLWS